jgi:hypothetical protein
MEATINTIRSELEETIKNWVEYILASVNQQTQGLCEELNTKIEEMHLGLQTSLNTWTENFCMEIEEIKRTFMKILISGCKEYGLR